MNERLSNCTGLVNDAGNSAQPALDALDELPYLTLYYANGPGPLSRTNLTDVNTR